MTRHDQARCHDGQDAAHVQLLCEQKDDEGREDLVEHVDDVVLEAAAAQQCDAEERRKARDDAKRDAAKEEHEKRDAGVGRGKRAGHRSGDGKLEAHDA